MNALTVDPASLAPMSSATRSDTIESLLPVVWLLHQYAGHTPGSIASDIGANRLAIGHLTAALSEEGADIVTLNRKIAELNDENNTLDLVQSGRSRFTSDPLWWGLYASTAFPYLREWVGQNPDHKLDPGRVSAALDAVCARYIPGTETAVTPLLVREGFTPSKLSLLRTDTVWSRVDGGRPLVLMPRVEPVWIREGGALNEGKPIYDRPVPTQTDVTMLTPSGPEHVRVLSDFNYLRNHVARTGLAALKTGFVVDLWRAVALCAQFVPGARLSTDDNLGKRYSQVEIEGLGACWVKKGNADDEETNDAFYAYTVNPHLTLLLKVSRGGTNLDQKQILVMLQEMQALNERYWSGAFDEGLLKAMQSMVTRAANQRRNVAGFFANQLPGILLLSVNSWTRPDTGKRFEQVSVLLQREQTGHVRIVLGTSSGAMRWFAARGAFGLAPSFADDVEWQLQLMAREGVEFVPGMVVEVLSPPDVQQTDTVLSAAFNQAKPKKAPNPKKKR